MVKGRGDEEVFYIEKVVLYMTSQPKLFASLNRCWHDAINAKSKRRNYKQLQMHYSVKN